MNKNWNLLWFTWKNPSGMKAKFYFESKTQKQMNIKKQTKQKTKNKKPLGNVILQFRTSNFISIKIKGLEESRTFQLLQSHTSFLFCFA